MYLAALFQGIGIITHHVQAAIVKIESPVFCASCKAWQIALVIVATITTGVTVVKMQYHYVYKQYQILVFMLWIAYPKVMLISGIVVYTTILLLYMKTLRVL